MASANSPSLLNKFGFRRGSVAGARELMVDGHRFVGRFTLTWEPARYRPISVRFQVEDGTNDRFLRAAMAMDNDRVASLTGRSDLGISCTAVGMIIVGTSDNPPTLDFVARQIVIGEERATTRIDCFLPNIELRGTEVSHVRRRGREPWRLNRTTLDLQTPVGRAHLVLSSRLKDVRPLLSRQSTVLSAVLSLRAKRHSVDRLLEVADDLAWLLGFATGGATAPLLVAAWSGRSIGSVRMLEQVYSRSRGADSLFPRTQPAALKSFLEQAYPRWNHLMHHAEPVGEGRKAAGPVMREVIAFYLESLATPSLPIPAYLVAYAFEALLQSDLFESTTSEFAVGVLKDELRLSFNEWVREAASRISDYSRERSKEFVKAQDNMFKNVMRRSFAFSLRALLGQYEVPYKNKWVGLFVRFRNDSVHGSFSSGSGVDKLVRDFRLIEQSQHVLELLILRILGYRGQANNRAKVPHTFENLPWVT